ncbi:bifunctional diguanylate cyclase/phosphodiesterase [Aquibacillus saliphilus]|uniref:bifunctional diguanylate cyclase/phosphodiesterase n=1 Tax=Aquibacillus saliphilus TaxID=1909422 RepID=UPI001CF013C3|nr:EAL domain-containing protein [Aquibacillus saliphilus]
MLLTLTSRQVLSDYSEEHYKTLSENTTSRIKNKVNNTVLDLKQLGTLVQENSSLLVDNTSQLNDYLRNVIGYSQYIDGGTIINREGSVIGYYPEDLQSVDNLMDRDYVQQSIRSKMIVFSNIVSTHNRDIVVMSIPLLKNHEVERVVNLSIHLKSNTFFHSLVEELEITEESYAYIIDDNGRILFHSNTNKIGKIDFSPNIIETVMSENYGYEKVTNEEDDAFYASYNYIGGLGWKIVALVPVKSTFVSSVEFQNILIPIFVTLSIVLFLIITFMMHQNHKPFTRLFEAIESISKGEYTTLIEGVDEKTEIGTIIAKFNVMVDELEQYKEENRQKTKELKKHRNFLNRVIDYNPNGIYAMNWSGEYTLANKEYASMFDLTPDDIIGKKEQEFNPDIESVQKYLKINRDVITSGVEREIEDYFLDDDGNKRWFHIGKVAITNDNGEAEVLTVATDITDRKQQEEVITHQAYHDDLTGIPNRKLFKKRLKQEVEAANENDYAFSLLFLDLDRFKYINDTFGHDAGDALLQMVSNRFDSCLSNQHIIFRLGGDEFTVIIPGVNQRQEVADLSKKILTALSEPYEIDGNRFIITASIGISIFPNDGQSADFLTKNADIAMYQAKDQGKNTFRFYTPDMETELAMKLKLEMDLYLALQRDELFIHYQPITDTKTESIAGMEALLRWEHPQLGLISPAQFVPIAEETGLIHSIGEWVLRTACIQTKMWQEEGNYPIKVSVNLSPVQLRDATIVDKVEGILQETGLDPVWLELEITESTIMENKREVVKILKRLRSFGVRIAIDDFGTGYSSLNVLKRLPIDTIKVDRSIVQHLLEKEVDDVILTAVFDIAKKMNLTVIAEGIETEEQYNYLKEKYCQYVQGFLFSQPLTNEQFIQFLKKKSHNDYHLRRVNGVK